MKKLTLNAKAFAKGEVLTKAQLKKVTGGYGGSGSGKLVDKIAACEYKAQDDRCVWLVEGNPIYGVCVAYLGVNLYCTDEVR